MNSTNNVTNIETARAKRLPCNGSHMVHAIVTLANGTQFGCYVSPPKCLEETSNIVAATGARVVSIAYHGREWTWVRW